MRKVVVTSAVLSLLLLLMPGPATAHHRPNASCSESGDVCTSARKVDGERILKIVTAANYFEGYRVCVTAPDDSRSCRSGQMRDGDGDGVWTGTMNWSDRFPDRGAGAYTVRWSSGDAYRSSRLGFHE